jgi:hypothetical protein
MSAIGDAENIEQDLINDVLSVKNAVVENWDDIQTNANQIENLIKDGLSWLDDNLEKEAKNLITDLKNVEGYLKELEKSSSLKNELGNAVSKLGSDLDPVIEKLEGLDDLDSVINTILDDIYAIDNIPPDIKNAIAPIKSILNAILGGGFSIAVKDLPANASGSTDGSEGANGGPGEASPGQTADFLSTLLGGLGTNFDNFIDNNETEIKTMIANMETVITDNDVTAMEGPINKMIENLPANGLTVKIILQKLETLATKEEVNIEPILTSLFKTMTGDLVSMETMLQSLLTGTVEEGHELCELYQEITGTKDVPSLLKIISIIIAIPVTLVSNIAECKFSIPASVFPPAKKSGNTFAMLDASEGSPSLSKEDHKLKMEAVLKIVKVEYLCVEELIDDDMEKSGTTVSYKYKLFTGCVEAVFSILEQALSSPYPSGESTDKGPWITSWFTDTLFCLSKSVTDAYQTKKIAELTSSKNVNKYITKISAAYDRFFIDYNKLLMDIDDSISQIYRIKKVKNNYGYLKVEKVRYSRSQINLLFNIKEGIQKISSDEGTSEVAIDSVISAINQLSISSADVDQIILGLQTVENKMIGKRDKDDKIAVTNWISTFEGYKLKYATIPVYLSMVKLETSKLSLSSNFEIAKANMEKILNLYYPAAGLSIQALNRIWTIYLYSQENTKDPKTLGDDLIDGIQFVGGNISSLYYYKNPPEEGSSEETNKTRIGYLLFGTGIVLNMYSVITKLISAQK